jgi:hypothetical protein
MIVEIEGAPFRISGEDADWQIQYEHRRKDGKSTWDGKYFFSSLEHAVVKAADLLKRKSPKKARSIAEAVEEVRRIDALMVEAVERAVGA